MSPMAALLHNPSALLCSLRPLFVVLNDEYVVVQALAIRVVGRLANSNPAYVMPALRRHLMQLLNDMDCSPDLRQREGGEAFKSGKSIACVLWCLPAWL